MGLQDEGKENEELVKAVGGLCGGIGGTGKTCGIITGAACLMGLYGGKGRPEEERDESLRDMISQFVDWFASEYGSLDCHDLIGEEAGEGIKTNSYPMKCGNLMSNSYKKIRQLLEEYEYIREDE